VVLVPFIHMGGFGLNRLGFWCSSTTDAACPRCGGHFEVHADCDYGHKPTSGALGVFSKVLRTHCTRGEHKITREIRQASSPTMRGHFGCILKGHWGLHNGSLVSVLFLYAYNGHLTMALVCPRWRKKKTSHHAHGKPLVMAMAMCGFMRG
jgi:hypothetical protein